MAELGEKRSRAIGWSDLHPEILAEIFRLLDLFDYVRCLAVCASWRSIPERSLNFCKPTKPQLPWLLIPPLIKDEPGMHCFNAKMDKRTIPQIADGRCIGSSQGFLISVDISARFSAQNPLTGARFPLPRHPDAPPGVGGPCPYTELVVIRQSKAAISPSLDMIAVSTDGWAKSSYCRGTAWVSFSEIAVARAGDDSWTALTTPDTRICNSDLAFHKGRLYVHRHNGSLLVFNPENPAAPPLVLPGTPRMKLGKQEGVFLTETPDREDILLLRRRSTRTGLIKLDAFRLDKNTLECNSVESIGDVALFLSGSYLSSLSTREFPRLRSNCVYFTGDDDDIESAGVYDLHNGNIEALSPDDIIKSAGVYDLHNGNIQYLNPDGDLNSYCWPSLLWFTPAP